MVDMGFFMLSVPGPDAAHGRRVSRFDLGKGD